MLITGSVTMLMYKNPTLIRIEKANINKFIEM